MKLNLRKVRHMSKLLTLRFSILNLLMEVSSFNSLSLPIRTSIWSMKQKLPSFKT